MTTGHAHETEIAMRVLSDAEIDAVVGGGMMGGAIPIAALAVLGISTTGGHGGGGFRATGGNGGN